MLDVCLRNWLGEAGIAPNLYIRSTIAVYLYVFGFGMSFDWSSQTGAGSRNGGCGGGNGVVVAGRIGPVFVLKSTRMEMAVEINNDINTSRTYIIYIAAFKQ